MIGTGLKCGELMSMHCRSSKMYTCGCTCIHKNN